MNEEKNYILAESDYVAGMKYKDIAAKYGVSEEEALKMMPTQDDRFNIQEE